MNKLILSLLFVACASGTAFAQADKQPARATQAKTYKSLPLGSRIPNADVLMTSYDGRKTSLQQEKTSKGLIVMFSCNTCPYVIKAQGRTREAMTQANQMGIGMVVINSNEAQRDEEDAPLRMREYAEIQKYTVPYVMDEGSRMADVFGATRTPEVFLFDAKGKLVYKGALEENPAEPEKSMHGYLVEAMRAMIAGKPINPSETKSIGCSIKRVAMK
jgi:thioredoxin-related protein